MLIPKPTDFINALSDDATQPIALGVTLLNRNTGAERTVDLLVDDDSFTTVVAAIRRTFDRNWGIYETWVIDDRQSGLYGSIASQGSKESGSIAV